MRFLALILVLACFFHGCASPSEPTLPNIIFILADDLGYGEVGAYGQDKIETPNIDALAAGGMLFTQHYSGAPVCAPARSVLMTGLHTGHTHIRGNDEWRERGPVWDYAAMFEDSGLEGQRPLLDSVITMAEMLKEAGYATGSVGKWGLGAPGTEGVPTRQGFDFFYGYNCQRQAHTFYPMHLWRNEERVLLGNDLVAPHENLAEDADPNDPESYARFTLDAYAPDLMHAEALQFIEEHAGTPFFLYYASPIPHLPLQAPKRWVDYYIEKFGPEEPFTGTRYFPNQTPKATYAAMISALDEQVGDLVEKLKELGVYDNTLVVFTSDNGPTFVEGVDTEFFRSAEPFRDGAGFVKGNVYEGGIRVPMIAHWPDRIEPGSTSDHISAFYDFMPTFAEIAGVSGPSTDGISMMAEFSGENQPAHDFLYWEFPSYNGQQAVRMGQWKGIRRNIFDGEMDVLLFDLESDLREEHNVAAQYPEVVERIEAIMAREHVTASLETLPYSAARGLNNESQHHGGNRIEGQQFINSFVGGGWNALPKLSDHDPMKRVVSLFALVLFITPAFAQSGAEEYPAVAQAVNYYLEGGTNNDFETLKKAFHETATMKFIANGEEYREVNALEFFESGMKPGPKQNRETRIVSVDIAGDAAFAKLEIEYPTFTFVDYMHLLKIDGEWKIVSKIFYRQPKAAM